MFEKEIFVRYGTHGVFQIKDILTKKEGKQRKQYYVMEAVYGVSTRITTPVENANIREILSEEAIHDLMAQMPTIEIKWNDDKRMRYEMFREMLTSNDPFSLVQVIKSIYAKREEKEAQKKAISDDDLAVFHHAEDILAEEICLRLQIEKEEVSDYILQHAAKAGE